MANHFTQARFYFVNLGETHYPCMLDGENLPYVSGVHGVFKGLSRSDSASNAAATTDRFSKAFEVPFIEGRRP